MKRFFSYLFFCLCVALGASLVAHGQEEARAAWQVVNFDLSANAPLNERALTARATLTVRNVGRGAGGSISLRINPKAEIKSASVGGAAATFRAAPEARTNLQRVTITLPASVAPNATTQVGVEYRLPIEENSGLAAISPLGAQFLPLSYWYPSPNTPFTPRGADYAPFRLSVATTGGESVISSGVSRSPGGQTFEQPLNAQVFFLVGSWDAVEGTNEARDVAALLPKGAPAEERKQAEVLIAFAGAARAYFASLLGTAPAIPVRLVSVTRGAGFNDAGTMLLDAAVFRRTKIDSTTALLVAESIARTWIGGQAATRGEGAGVVREGLSRYLATLFLEKQFGRETADAERLRQRIAYAAVARRDGPLALSPTLGDTYFASVPNKGAMIWRLADRALGRDAFIGVIRPLVQAGGREGGEVTLASARAAFAERGGATLKGILDYGFDQPTDADLLIGLPQQRGNQWVAALRNTGSLDVNVTVAATTDRGERVTAEASIPARGFGEAVFQAPSRIVRVEVDPDKFYPQLDYSNDVAPNARLTEAALGEATRLFAQQNYSAAESTARGLLALTPRLQEARTLVARALLAQNRIDEAEREFRATLDERLPSPAALAWAAIGLGEIALKRGQAAEAVKRFNEAVRVDAEYASSLAAREGRIRAEAAANQGAAPDESVRAFIAQLDQAIKNGRKTELEALIVPGELTSFVKGIVGSQPERWQTRVIRTELLGANRFAADVGINAKQFGREQSGTAVMILARVGGNLRLAGVELFEVR